jgi:polar amino acid transport system permease protein
MSCTEIIADYGLRSLGIGERLLPRSDFTLCHQFTLIGSGLIWNIYFGVLALAFGFFLATGLALAKAAEAPLIRKPAEWFIFVFRGSPLFIQFFLAYEALVMLPRAGINIFGLTVQTSWVTSAWAGALFVLFLNTAAYSAEIFYGALRSVPKGDIEAADAYGLTGWNKFFSGFPAYQQRGDALYYAKFFADKTFNPFIPYPIAAFYFICVTLALIGLFGVVNRRLNRHLPQAHRPRLRIRPQIIR